MKNKLFMGLLLCALCIVTMACNQRVPAGYKGRVNTVDGCFSRSFHLHSSTIAERGREVYITKDTWYLAVCLCFRE